MQKIQQYSTLNFSDIRERKFGILVEWKLLMNKRKGEGTIFSKHKGITQAYYEY